MKIEKVELIQLKLPFIEYFEISSGKLSNKDIILIKIYADDLVGIGESVPMPAPFYSAETPITCFHIIKDFIVPQLLGREIKEVGDVSDIFLKIRGNNFAKAGIETALWDLFAKYNRKPLYEFVGGKKKDIPWKISIGIKPSIDKLLDTVENSLNNGIKNVKIKIKKGWDVEPVRNIRERFGDIELTVDANSFYTLDDIDVFKELDKYDLAQIEQPLHYEDLYDHYILQNKINTPICLDESIHSVTACKNALDMDCCRIVNIKVQRVGGIGNSILIHDMCSEKGIPVWVGAMFESGVGIINGLAVCSLPNAQYSTDMHPSGTYIREDIITPYITMNNKGNIELPDGVGLGCNLDEDKINRFKINTFEFKK